MFYIFGSRGFRTELGTSKVQGRCPHCHNEVTLSGERSGRKFTFFFIPLYPLEYSHYLLCPICRFGNKVSKQEQDTYLENELTTEQFFTNKEDTGSANPKMVKDGGEAQSQSKNKAIPSPLQLHIGSLAIAFCTLVMGLLMGVFSMISELNDMELFYLRDVEGAIAFVVCLNSLFGIWAFFL